MKGYVFDFNINEVKFDERFIDQKYGTVTLYFICPKEWLNDIFPEATHSEISIEYPINQPEAIYASVMMSPTKEDSAGNAVDYNWLDIVLLPQEIEQLMNLADKTIGEK